jgi:nucleoside-diphosphate-sugar epimerase
MAQGFDAGQLRGRRVCVTGGAGFIGSHIGDALNAAGAKVTVLDDLSTGCKANVATPIRFVSGSILDKSALAEGISPGTDTVFHLAAITSVPQSVAEPYRTFEVNVMGSLAVLEAARSVGVQRVIFASSSAVYGDDPVSPKVETMPPVTLSPYAASKCASEHLLRSYASCYDLIGVSLRLFNIFGPRQQVDSPYAAAIPLFVSALLEGRPITIYGDGEQTRDFTHVANVVSASLRAATSSGTPRGEAVNIACGKSCTVLELIDRLASLLGATPQLEFQPSRPGDVKHSAADISIARTLIGYEPVMSFADGLADAITYYRQDAERRNH